MTYMIAQLRKVLRFPLYPMINGFTKKRKKDILAVGTILLVAEILFM
jgi:hypothetical protein